MPDTFEPSDAFGLLRSYSRHRDYVRLALTRVVHAIEERAIEHDASKMLDDEFAGFARINAAARINKFGSAEYSEGMKRERETIDKHFSRNSHHPERPGLIGAAAERERGGADDFTYWHTRGPVEMTFLDVIEMVCDWWGAQKGYDDNKRTWAENVALNLEHKGKYLDDHQKWLVQQVAALLADKGPALSDQGVSVPAPETPRSGGRE